METILFWREKCCMEREKDVQLQLRLHAGHTQTDSGDLERESE